MTASHMQLRPWPTARLPVPDVPAGCGRWIASDGLIRWEEESIGQRWLSIPEEFWMRELLDADLDDPEAVAEFCTAYGMLDVGLLNDTAAAAPEQPVVLDDYRLAARRVRNVARDVLAQAGAPRRWREERELDGLENFSRDGRQRWTVARLGQALRPMHPRLVACDVDGFDGGYDRQQIGLLTPIAVQVFNFILGKAHVSICAWGECSREYVFQRGRSEFGGHKSGSVRYCCPEHAKLAANKAYRERKRKPKTDAEGGETP